MAAWLAGQKVMYKDGKEYVAANGYHMMIILRRDGEVYTPVAAAGGLSRLTTGDGTAHDVWDSDIGHHSYKLVPGLLPRPRRRQLQLVR